VKENKHRKLFPELLFMLMYLKYEGNEMG